MINAKMLAILLLTFVLPGAIGVMAAPAAAPKVVTTVADEIVSMAPGADGVVLLAADGRLIVVDRRGGTRTVSLPPLPTTVPAGGAFTDLAVQGSRVTLCRYETPPRLYQLDLVKPDTWTVQALTGLPGREPRIVSLDTDGETLQVIDTSDRRYRVGDGGKLSALPSRSFAPRTPAGEVMVWDGPRVENGLNAWRITTDAGQEVLARAGADPAHNVLNLGVVGFDPKGRLLFFEVTGAGELNNVYTLHAATAGKVVASARFDAPGPTAAMKPIAMLADGSVWVLRKDAKTGRHRVLLLRLG